MFGIDEYVLPASLPPSLPLHFSRSRPSRCMCGCARAMSAAHPCNALSRSSLTRRPHLFAHSPRTSANTAGETLTRVCAFAVRCGGVMAHLIAPASSVQPMTEEDFAVVQAEKRVDAATREQLVNVYGDSRAPHGRRVALTRPPKREWRCAACGKRSADIRHVCAFCLSPEPGYSSNIAASRPRNAGGPAVADKVVGPLTCVQRPGTCEDADVRLLQVSLTNRTYRVFTEPHTSAAKPRAAASHRSAAGADSATARPAVEEVDEVMVWDDEPNCGDRGTGESCSAGDDEGGSECDDEGVPSPAPHTQRRPPRAEKVNGGFTHFVSIPFGKLPAVAANATSILADLRSFVAAKYAESAQQGSAAAAGEAAGPGGTAASSFSKSAVASELVTGTAKLHMTLLLLTLPRREDVEFAKELLHGPFASAWAATKEKWAASKDTTYALSGDASLAPVHRHPLVRLGGGLQVMRTGRQNEFYHPEKASVVYMGIDNAAGLATVQQLQRVLHESLAELIHDPEEAEKSRRVLHVTIMDKKWRKGRAASRPFDARPIMEAFQEAAIGAGEDGRQLFEIPELELCSLRRQDPESGTYLAETTVKI
ncbi:hypothetical protein, conserved [Leishmania donovani]|uniref:A-kinase anchor protein 7-like phosphoesterase domain-containing protein n=1 Tax=Leishmania donovani TaxID=5661 RepID=E9BGX1_LEIDO|nr:hypothetical protein, conserved [Leishmania donovani]CBZ34497.1 hypothetical protein, conserved [Leishmania donovani]